MVPERRKIGSRKQEGAISRPVVGWGTENAPAGRPRAEDEVPNVYPQGRVPAG